MKQAMIFAAGLGTRLRPLTNDRPKALVEVAGKTLLEHNLLKLKAAGFDHIVINVHHFAEKIYDFLAAHDHFGMRIAVSDERDLLLDTGGGIRRALSLLDPASPVLIHNVDIISDIDVAALYEAHLHRVVKRNGANEPVVATLAVNRRSTSRYLMMDEAQCLCGWTNVQTGEVRGRMGEKYAFAGIHVIDPGLFPTLLEQREEVFPIVPFYLSCCDRVAIHGVDVTESAWVDCGKVESLRRAEEIVENQREL